MANNTDLSYTTEFTYAVPYLSGGTANSKGKVVEWELGMTYSYGTSGHANWYQSEFDTQVFSSWITGLSSDFTPKAENQWTRAELMTLMSPATSLWDRVFTSQVDSVIINPPASPIPDKSYVIPDEG
jgi:hypothetical protein